MNQGIPSQQSASTLIPSRPPDGSAKWRIGYIVECTGGGVGKHVLELVGNLDRSIIQPVLYVSFDRPDSRVQDYLDLAAKGIPLHQLKMRRGADPIRDIPTAIKLARLCKQDGIELLHGHSSKGGLLARMVSLFLRIPVVYTAHGFSFFVHSPAAPVYRWVERGLGLATKRFICVSESEKEAASQAGLPAHKMAVIPNGIDLNIWIAPTKEERLQVRRELGVDDATIIIGNIGRMMLPKNQSLLVQAMPQLIARFDNLKLVLWGDGEQKPEVSRLIDRLGLQSHVILAGHTDNPRRAYQAMDVFVSPSLWEAGPYVVMEAMACELPVVVSATAGSRDIVQHGHNGMIVPIADLDATVQAISQIIQQPAWAAEMGRHARELVVQQYSLVRMVRRTELIYQEILADK